MGFRAQGFRVWGEGFRVQGFRVWGLGLVVWEGGGGGGGLGALKPISTKNSMLGKLRVDSLLPQMSDTAKIPSSKRYMEVHG